MNRIFSLIIFFHLVISHLFAQNATNACFSSRPIRVVVLGSSTAEGVGPSTIDSAWVNLYREYITDLNSSNEVINLAKSGYTTYHLMPDNFVPPATKPTPDTARNITKALSLNPDVIIVNMPSNDAYLYYGVNEQLINFKTVSDSADAQGVPIYICTPQPRNFDPLRIQIQRDLTDSIIARYDTFAIDFWNGIAQTNGDINPIYNSGDNIHLNATGHQELLNRVKNKQIPNYLYDPGVGFDYFVFPPLIPDANTCGDSSLEIILPIGNIGQADSSQVPISLTLTHTPSGVQTYFHDTIQTGLGSCLADTFFFIANTYQGGEFHISAKIVSPLDRDSSNNQQQTNRSFTGHPELNIIEAVICDSGATVLEAITAPNDTVIWYDSLNGGDPIHFGKDLFTPFLTASQTYYAQAVRGNLFYYETLLTTTESDKTWNGAMFDIIGHDSISIDSLAIKINSLGNQTVMIYQKTGSYQGFENTPSSWALHDSLSVQVANSDSLIMLFLDSIQIAQGDTIGLYIHLFDSNSRLSYQSLNQPKTRNDGQIEVFTGSGITHSFGATYFPRDLNLEVFYHYGERLEGECATPRVSVTATVRDLLIDLGSDTVITITDSILLAPTLSSSTGNTYLWSDSSFSDHLTISGNDFDLGTYCFWVEVIDDQGCMDRDTTCITFTESMSLENDLNRNIQIFPNPTKGHLSIKDISPLAQKPHLTFYNMKGEKMSQWRMIQEEYNKIEVDISLFPSGLYLLKSTSESGVRSKIIIKNE